MTLTAIKQEVRNLKLQDQIELADYLAQETQGSADARRARIDRRMKSMDGGKKITAEQLLSLHQAMKAAGI